MVKVRPDELCTKMNMASSEQHTNIITSGWWKRSPTNDWFRYTSSNPFEFVRFENSKHRNIFNTPSYERHVQAALRGVDISGNVKLYIPQDKFGDYHTEELDEFLSEFRVYKKEGDTA